MHTLFQDVRYGLRMLRKNPGFAIVAVLTLALGIGANTAIFSLINAVLLKSLPVHDPQQLVIVSDPSMANSHWIGTPTTQIYSYPLYRDLRDGNNVFSGMAASGQEHQVKVETPASGVVTEDATINLVSGNYFSVLGVAPFRGRTLVPDDDRAKSSNPVAVVSYEFWIRKLAEDPGIVGQTMRLNKYPFTIIGIAAPGFFGDTVGDKQDFWVPVSMQPQLMPGRPWLDDFQASWLRVIARLKPGVSRGQAEANLNVLFRQWLQGPQGRSLDPGDQQALKQQKIFVVAGGQGFSGVRAEFSHPLVLLMAIVGLVLLIACVNVANLMLARANSRQREIAVRLAIGASPGHLVRQLLTESLLLAFAGGIAGLLVARWGTESLLKLSLSARAAEGLTVSPDWRVLAFTACVCVVTGLLFGLAPALRSAKLAVAPTLKENTVAQAGSGRFPLGKILVASQVAVCLLVLFAAGLLVRSLKNLRDLDLGYSRNNILMAHVDPVAAGYKPAQLIDYEREMSSRLAALPGVRSVTASENGLFSGTESADDMKIEGYTAARDQDRVVYWDQVGVDYFHALGIPILMGRDFGPRDTPTSTKVAIINEAMAKFYFGNSNPIGRKMWIDDQQHKDQPMEIIGVARDVRDHTLRGPIQRRFYVPTGQALDAMYAVNFEIQTAGKPQDLTEPVRKAFAALDANVPVSRIRTLDELVDSSVSKDILVARLSTFFGLLALALACVGLYGVMSYTVSRRTREIGVRMALGAQRTQVLGMVLSEGLKLVLIGILIGIPVALLSTRVFSSMLFGLSSADPLSMVLVVLILGTIASIAGLIPARRATKVDPIIALRYE
ncbi:MAG TPA: ABC transporter permease [Candidatus Angelobacter sp.]|nr:ABC transporter permease [Candidatus Angelobacter sp.]